MAYVGVSVPLTVVLGLALGIALNRPLPGRAVLRAIFFLPYIVNVVAIGMTWLMLMNPKAGLVNQVLDTFGLQPGWFASSHWALPALIVMAVWGGVGYCSLIYLSALQDAPRQLYEAADIDGAGAWAKFRRDHLAGVAADNDLPAGDADHRRVPGLRVDRADHRGRSGRLDHDASRTTCTRRASSSTGSATRRRSAW